MKNNRILYIILASILFVLLVSSIYVNFIAKNSVAISYVLLVQIIIGIMSAIVTLFLCRDKKNYQVLLIAFLEILFTMGLVTLNTMYGYSNVLDITNYGEYMEYVSMNMNIYIFTIFGLIIGVFSLNQFIKYHNELKK